MDIEKWQRIEEQIYRMMMAELMYKDWIRQDAERCDSCIYCGAYWEDGCYEECPTQQPVK